MSDEVLEKLVTDYMKLRFQMSGFAWQGGGTGVRDALAAAGYTVMDADQLKTWMYPIARSLINKRTKYSEVPIRLRAPGNTPFSEVRKVLEVVHHEA